MNSSFLTKLRSAEKDCLITLGIIHKKTLVYKTENRKPQMENASTFAHVNREPCMKGSISGQMD